VAGLAPGDHGKGLKDGSNWRTGLPSWESARTRFTCKEVTKNEASGVSRQDEEIVFAIAPSSSDLVAAGKDQQPGGEQQPQPSPPQAPN